MASNKRAAFESNESEPKKAKLTVSDSTNRLVKLSDADCDLEFDIEANGLQGHALYEKGFAYCWSGARANVGIRGGKYCFGCKVVEKQPVEMEDTPPDQQHVCRVGISRGDDTVGNLGETPHSFGFGGTGKFSSDGKFLNYGEKFGLGDTIVCAVDLESKPFATVGFFKNGKWLGIARQFDAGPKGLGAVDCPVKKLEWESALFPHVLLKNVVVQVQFSVEDGLVPLDGYKPWSCAFKDGNGILGPVLLENKKDCEIMMMVGLPASGKTSWAEKWVKEHPEKRYLILGTNLALDQMKVPGLLRKQNYGERFDRLMSRATDIFNILLARAAKTPRNYIIDQTNVYKNARKRKMKPFFQFRKIAVVVFPTPDELKFRGEKRFKEMGKEVPAEAVNEMLANYVLPTSKDMPSDEPFDRVMFTELNREDAQRYLEGMKHAMKTGSDTPYSRESSVKSFASSTSQTPRISTATGRHPQNRDSPLPLQTHDYQRHQQVNSGYSGSGLQGQPQYASGPYQSDTGLDSYGNYVGLSYNQRISSESRSPIPGGRFGSYDNYAGIDSYGRPDSGNRSSLPAGSADLYQSHRGVGDRIEQNRSYGGRDLYGTPNSRSRNVLPAGSADPYQSPGGASTYPLSTSYDPSFGTPPPRIPYQNSPASAGLPYGTPPSRLPYQNSPASAGLPYRTPPPQLPYGNVPAARGDQYEGFSGPPTRRYY